MMVFCNRCDVFWTLCLSSQAKKPVFQIANHSLSSVGGQRGRTYSGRLFII